MQEHTATVDGVTHALPHPFLVLATQNPLEFEGTFPLPEAQLDRFLMQLAVGYPSRANEAQMLRTIGSQHPIEQLQPLPNLLVLEHLQQALDHVFVSDSVVEYLLRVVDATRQHPDLALGASPRASLALHRAAQALAALEGRRFVIPDDVKRLARPVLQHRLVVRAESALRGRTASTVLADVVQTTPVDVDVLEQQP
jgi:MoxR-like ATPase